MQKLQKMKILGIFRSGISIPNKIQPEENSTGGAIDGEICISDGNPNVINSNRYDDGSWLNTYWDNLANEWNDDGAFAFVAPLLSLFLSRLRDGGVLFLKLTNPSAEHSADFLHRLRKFNIFFRIHRFCFPKDHQKYFQRVNFSCGKTYIRRFFFARKKSGNGDGLDCFNKKIVNSFTERIPLISDFLSRKLKIELHPQKLFLKTLASGVDFLGWVHFTDYRVLRTTTKRRMMKRIAIHPTKGTLASYMGLLKHGNAKKLQMKI